MSACSLVSQDPVIWRASLRDNLDPEGRMRDEELWDALRIVDLETAVGELENKLETMLEEGGSLSKGQVRAHIMSTNMSP